MVDLKNLDFASQKTTTEKFDFTAGEESTLQNARTVAYVLNWQLAKRRAGTAQTKTMSEISGTTAKPHKQKGTGTARQGSKRSVQFRGGRTCFGPRARSFDYAIPKKIVKDAMSEVIKLKFKEGKVVSFSGSKDNLKTTEISKLLKLNNINQALFLYSSDSESKNIAKSVRNIKNVKALDVKGLNAYDVLKFDFLVLDKSLFQTIKEVAF